MPFPLRANKFFTEAGYCSRREADRLIEAGRVRINGRVARLGDSVQAGDEVTVDGRIVRPDGDKRVYVKYNKPPGVISTTDRSIPGNIIDAVKHPSRIFPVGRLDKDSKGLILLTNDGDIVNKILRAQFGHEKEYVVHATSPVSDDFLKAMSRGVDIGGYVTRPCPVTRLNPSAFSIVLTEGKNRQIRRMCEALGAKVRHLERVRIMNILLGALPPGRWSELSPVELEGLMAVLAKTPSGAAPGPESEE